MTMPIFKIGTFLVSVILAGTMTVAVSAKTQSDQQESGADIAAPFEPPSSDISESQLFTELLAHNQQRNATFAVVRIAGHPAKKLSFWIERADFVREYQKIDGFWLPQKDETFVQVRMYGQKVLTIDHQRYTVAGGRNTEESVQTTEN